MRHNALGSRQRWAFAGLVVVTYGLMAGVWLSAGHEDPVVATAVPPSPGPKAIACVETSSDPEDSGICQRRVQDLQTRQPITDQQEAEAKAAGDKVFSALPPIPWSPQHDCDGPNGPCAVHLAPIDEAYVASARKAITKAGYPTGVIRLSHAGDPGMMHSLIYGVDVGQACAIGYLKGSNGSHWLAGRLRDGTCLSP